MLGLKKNSANLDNIPYCTLDFDHAGLIITFILKAAKIVKSVVIEVQSYTRKKLWS